MSSAKTATWDGGRPEEPRPSPERRRPLTPRRSGPLLTGTTSFVGRRREIADIRDAVTASRLVTLIGPGGVGKTRLALRAASEMVRAFPDGIHVVELASVHQADAVPNTVVHALGISDQSHREPSDKVLDHLQGRELLLVLDNCEHVIDGAVRLIDRVLRSAGSVRILATSRITLGVTEEMRYQVPRLSLPCIDEPVVSEPTRYEAVRLFLDRAETAVPGFEPTDAIMDRVVRLCLQLEGIPLAIELAVARLRTLSLEQIEQRLSDRFGLLSKGSRTADPRQQTLRALIDWSYALCSPAERHLWASLSVFSGGFDLAAVEGVCAATDGQDGDVLDLLGSLVDQSVVIAERDGDEVRFRMLETIREYGAERLEHSGRSREVAARHRRYFIDLATGIADRWCGPDQLAGVRILRTERDNLRAVMDGCAVDGAHAESVELVAALRYRWYADGYIAQGRRWADEVLERRGVPPEPTRARATTLWSAAWVCLLQGERDVAARRTEECAELAEQIDDPVAKAYVRKLRGLGQLFRGDLRAAATSYDEAVLALTAVREWPGLLATSFQYALTLTLDGEFARAQAVIDRALAISQERGDRWCRSYIQWVHGVHCMVQGDVGRADEFGRTALGLHRVFSLSVGTALMTELLAWTAHESGESERAAELLGGADSLWNRAGTGIAAFGPHLSGLRSRCYASVADVLDGPTFRRAIERGASRDTEATIACALSEVEVPAHPPAGEPAGGQDPLTPRQREIARLIATGMSNREIAAELVLSVRTVESHVEHILDRLGHSTRSQVAAWVAQRSDDSG